MNVRTIILCLKAAGAVLVFSGIAKVLSTPGSAMILTERDPLLFLNYRQLLLIVGLVEIGSGIYLLSGRTPWTKAVVLGFLSGNFLLYRFGLQLIGGGPDCPCLGRMMEWLKLSPAVASTLTLAASVVLFAGSTAVIWQIRRMTKGANTFVAVKA